MEINFGEELPPDPCLQAAQLKYQLSHKSFTGTSRSTALTALEHLLISNNMTHFATICSEALPDLAISADSLKQMAKNNSTELKSLEDSLAKAKENEGDVEVLDFERKVADFYFKTSSKEETLSRLTKLQNSKTMSTGQKIDNSIRLTQLGLFWLDLELIQRSIDDCEKLLQIGGDWERRNRLAVYKAFYLILTRSFGKAAESLISVLPTFGATELCSFDDLVFYCVVSSIATLRRSELKAKVVDSPQVKGSVKNTAYLSELLSGYYSTDYATMLQALIKLVETKISTDRYIGQHSAYLLREIKLKAFAQFLQPFKSVTIELMSYEFQLEQNVLEKELSRLIANGRLKAKIDSVNGVIETFSGSAESKGTQEKYAEVIKQGDLLLNKIQTLSRVLGV